MFVSTRSRFRKLAEQMHPGIPLISPGCARQINDFQRNVRTRRSAMLLTYLIFPYEATV